MAIEMATRYNCGLLYVDYLAKGIKNNQAGKAEIPDKYKDDVKAILDTFTEMTTVHYREDGKAAETIRNRLAEGYARGQLIAMMRFKHGQWVGTDYLKYMRPETVMRASNCQRYMNELKVELSKPRTGEERISNIAAAIDRAKAGI